MPPTKKATGAPKTAPQVMRVTYGGVDYDMPLAENAIPQKVRRELFLQSGLTLPSLGQAIDSGQADVFMFAAFVFVAKRLAGETVAYAALEESFDPALLTHFGVVEDAGPEA